MSWAKGGRDRTYAITAHCARLSDYDWDEFMISTQFSHLNILLVAERDQTFPLATYAEHKIQTSPGIPISDHR